MRRIYLEIYLSVIATALVVTVGLGVFARWYFDERHEAERVELQQVGELFVDSLSEGADPVDVDAALAVWARETRVMAVLWDARGELRSVAGRGTNLGDGPGGAAGRRSGARHEANGSGPMARGGDTRRWPPPWAWTSVALEGGGSLEIASMRSNRDHRWGPWLFLASFLGIIGIAAYPVSRRITRGLEELRTGVSELGEGDLDARVLVKGHNEVADVARAFNAAAEKSQRGVLAQRRVLASASHELRTPLTRLRAAVELIAEGRGERLADAERDIEELDALIEDLLLAGRIGAAAEGRDFEEVDLMSIVRDEAERAGASCTGSLLSLMGEARMLRRLVSNLIENAYRHGVPPVTVTLESDAEAGRCRIVVSDAGGGVPLEERERIFEPFYRAIGHSESRDGGVGLGLALVAEIAEHHGGTARCVGDEERGSVFVIELPCLTKQVDSASAAGRD